MTTGSLEPLTVVSQGLRLIGERWPAAAERGVVILLPGGGQTRHSWDRSAALLQEAGWTVVTMDLRGHGESDWADDGDYSIPALAADLLATVDALDCERPPVLVGASMGGLTAMSAAGTRPGCCTALVLVDVAPRIESAGRERIRAFMGERPEGFASLEEAAAAVAAYREGPPRPPNLESLRKNLRRGPDGRWRWHWDPQLLLQTHDSDDPRHPERVRLTEAATAVEVPVLLVRGVLSDILSTAGLEEARRLFPQAVVAEVSQAGHMVAGDDNETFLEAITRFLDGLDADSAHPESGS